VKGEESDVIDLTQDENEDCEMLPASKILDPIKENESITRDEVYTFAQDDASATLPELLGCITHDELKNIGKQLKVTKTGQSVSTDFDIIFSRLTIYCSVQVYQRQLYPTLRAKQPWPFPS
jgi:hypothetical protein